MEFPTCHPLFENPTWNFEELDKETSLLRSTRDNARQEAFDGVFWQNDD
jgi:hypothetical protein